jgi:hypothetical protein
MQRVGQCSAFQWSVVAGRRISLRADATVADGKTFFPVGDAMGFELSRY